MTCFYHPETPATAFCRTCGKALCPACQKTAFGTVYCVEHLPVPIPNEPPSPYTAPVPPPGAALADTGASPGLAFLLGLIPGVGAIYNGQYVKGLIHVVILGLLISIVGSDAAGGFEPLFGLLIGVWVFYMAFEAYHTARRRQLGQPVDEFSSLVPLRENQSRFPVGPAVLIALGLFFLLNNLNVIRFHDVIRFWPLALIVLGAYMLYARIAPVASHPIAPPPEVSHER